MRGKPLQAVVTKDAERITPADAGKTPSGARLILPLRDHPRGCGENITAPDELGNVLGSPPRMRGKLAQCAPETCENRITPADAGKTFALAAALQAS